MNEEDLVYRLRLRAEIRRQIHTRKSVQEGKPDRIADLLEKAADEIERLRNDCNQSFDTSKFSELIVAKCCSIADDWVNNYNDGKNYPSERIKDHFRVKDEKV
jgi:hypothetical protein